jgi:general secretion pathway protein K
MLPGDASRRSRRGGALLAVLWLTAALTAIAFSLAATVRGEIDRASTQTEGLRTYYLAQGAVQRGILYMLWGAIHRLPDGSSPYYKYGAPLMRFAFPSGEAVVEVIPESSKLNLNGASQEQLMRLLLGLGVDIGRAQLIASAIVDWRRMPPDGGPTMFDQHYLSMVPSFPSRHASFEQIEELLVLHGMTPEIYYGTYDRDHEGRLIPRGGLRDCVTVFSTSPAVDVNTAHPAVLQAVGLDPAAVAAIVAQRRLQPFVAMEQVLSYTGGVGRVRIGGDSIYTLRATARLRHQDGQLSDLKRTVAAKVKLLGGPGSEPYHVLRWYDNEWVP